MKVKERVPVFIIPRAHALCNVLRTARCFQRFACNVEVRALSLFMDMVTHYADMNASHGGEAKVLQCNRSKLQ